jgi:hypothetical protein
MLRPRASGRVFALGTFLLWAGGCQQSGGTEARCTERIGYIGEPATSGTQGVWNYNDDDGTEGPESLSFAEQRAPRQPMLKLTDSLDVAVEARTGDGRTIACQMDHEGRYHCREDAGLRSVTVNIGEQSWTEPIPAEECWWEDYLSFWLEDVAGCREPAATIVAGTLLGYDPASAPPVTVGLLGPALGLFHPGDAYYDTMGELPYRRCDVSGDRFTCTSLGYRADVEHTLRVQVGDQIVLTRGLLSGACPPEPARWDVQACPSGCDASQGAGS